MPSHAELRAIEYYLPEATLSTSDLSRQFPDWPVEKIQAKTGIACRHIAGEQECASDLAVQAAHKLFASGVCQPEDIDYLLFCTQSPDYLLPTTACLLQDRLKLPTTAGALDYNLGCSGYIYGLGLAQALIASQQARSVLLLTAETYSKFLHPADRSVRTLFGDAAAATLLVAAGREQDQEQEQDQQQPSLGPFVYGTDGAGGANLIVRTGGMRQPRTEATAVELADEQGNIRSADNLFMDGPEIFNFTLSAVPESVDRLLERSGLSLSDIDLFVFHQANQYMLDHLRKRLKIPAEKFFLAFRDCGNTVSSTIPIALKHAALEGRLSAGTRVMLVGFGVGYSWGATLWTTSSGWTSSGRV